MEKNAVTIMKDGKTYKNNEFDGKGEELIASANVLVGGSLIRQNSTTRIGAGDGATNRAQIGT